jgi:hypothetical protein
MKGAKNLRFGEGVKVLDLTGTKVTDAVFSILSNLKRLESLSLQCIRCLTGAGIQEVATLPHLAKLFCSFAKIAEANGFSRLKNIKELWLEECRNLTEEALQEIGRMVTLERLRLSRSRLTDAGIEHLHSLRQLRILEIDHTRLTKLAVEKLQELLPDCTIIRVVAERQ